MESNELLNSKQIEKYHFFKLVEFICQIKVVDVENLLRQFPTDEVVRFIGEPSLAFVTRDVISVTQNNNYFDVKVPFLNLIGAHSPLPNYYLDDIFWEELQQEPRITALLNLFNHRLVLFLYKIWRKYRYFLCFKENGDDEFSRKMFALIGLEANNIRNLLQVNPSKMLSYAGILTGSGRSPQLLVTLIKHCFELSDVKVLSWQLRKVSIAKPQLNKLGIKNCTLGKGFILGSKIADYNGKFILVISNLSLRKMQKLLPNGSIYKPLVNLVSFILRDQLAWDLHLVLADNQVNTMKLGVNNNCNLGWTTFLGKPPQNPNTVITIRT